MCTSIVKIASVQGSGKGTQKWFPVTQMVVTDDHPTHAFLEHSINIDFVNEAMAPSSRVALELTPESGAHPGPSDPHRSRPIRSPGLPLSATC